MADLPAIAGLFKPGGEIVHVREVGGGNINDTFLVTLHGTPEKQFILQRLNLRVFRRPDLVMRNMRISTEHLLRRLEAARQGQGRRWVVPRVLFTEGGSDHWVDAEGSFWRALSFIEDAQSFDTIRDIAHAGEVGYAVGMFHTLLSDLPAGSLADALEGFHITPLYLRHYDEVLTAKHVADDSPEMNYCRKFVEDRRAFTSVLEDAAAAGKLVLRTIHGDPKVDNIMIDNSTGQAVSIIDLDTVKPGLVQYDIGDCLRSGCNDLGEETEKWESVRFDTDLCRAILNGYLSVARSFLTGNDFDYIYDSIRLIAFELGLRLLTDHLEGDVYFKVVRNGQNLARALMQFKLTESIELQERAIRAIIRDIRQSSVS